VALPTNNPLNLASQSEEACLAETRAKAVLNAACMEYGRGFHCQALTAEPRPAAAGADAV